MRNTTFKITSLVLTATVLSSCDVLKELEYKVTPNPLEMHGDSVRVKIDVKVPEKGIKKGDLRGVLRTALKIKFNI